MGKTSSRILLAIFVIILDLIIVFVPVSAFFIAYIIIARPPELKTWINKLYEN